jgi:hypothetical protein
VSYGSNGQSALRLPADKESAYAILDSFTGSRNATTAMLDGTRLPGAELAMPDRSTPGARRAQLAQAMAGTMTDVAPMAGVRTFPSIGSVTVERLASGALRVGAIEMTAASLLTELDRQRERAEVLSIIARYSLNTSEVVDILAARAYVWADNMLPMSYWSLPWSGKVHDQVAETIMYYERDHPGTAGLASRGNAAALAAIDTMVNEITAGVLDDPNILYRTSSVSPALSTSSSRARAILATTTMQQWQAHHLIPFAVMASMPVPFQQAVVASGWVMDSAENLIPLPANLYTFLSPPNNRLWPMHNSAHPKYDADVRVALVPVLAATFSKKVSSTDFLFLRSSLKSVENFQRKNLFDGKYHPKVS